ncbi:MAG TPA: helix-turn-helix domain-containing protein [Polyangiaceae bacterium]|nr:helix-turn-helix domain-containing protein [Polyangiaceae bacterium]
MQVAREPRCWGFTTLCASRLRVGYGPWSRSHRLSTAGAHRCCEGALGSTTLSVESITQRIGYQNVSAFARLFGREVGQSPGQYR